MKTIKPTISALCLLLVSLAYGQTLPICTNFENGSFDGWQNYNTTSAISSPSLDNSNYLQLTDGSGGSWGYNSTSYPSDWTQFIDYCLCFDYKVFNDGHVNTVSNVHPWIAIYNGTDPHTATMRATFIGNITITENDGWVHVCAPILPSVGNVLPSNGDGQWTNSTGILTSADWNALLSNVGGIAFGTDIAGSGSQSEQIGVDNICLEICSSVPAPSDDGANCCDSTNFVTNGNFEFGNTGFSSSYTNNPLIYPGEYSVANSAAALSVFNAAVTDHSFCADPTAYSSNNQFLLVNGKTQKGGNSNAVIWEQTISGLDTNSTYKFCANFKNMPQCTFDILPNVKMRVVGLGNSGFNTISAVAANPCDWGNQSLNFNTGTNTSVTLQIRLDQSGNGDGNDLAIDDISVSKLIDPNLSITVQHQGTPQVITASINTISTSDDALSQGADCEYHWWVTEVTNYPFTPPPSPPPASFVTGNASGNSVGTTPWNLTTTFPDYVFNNSTLYMIGLYTPACGCYDEGFTYQLTYNSFDEIVMTEEQKQQIIDWILNGNVGGPLGVENQIYSGSDDILIYPNPVKDNFTVSLTGNSLKSIEVLSLSGQSILAKNYTEGKAEEILDISQLASGIYLIKAKGIDDKQFISRVVKE